VLSSERFRETFQQFVPDTNMSAFDSTLNHTFKLKFSLAKEGVIAFCSVYREDDPTSIYFNPNLILNLLQQTESSQFTRANSPRIIIHLCKIMHEISHIFHYYSSTLLRSSKTEVTWKQSFHDSFKKRVHCTKQINQVSKDVDYYEKTIFGRLFGARSCSWFLHGSRRNRLVSLQPNNVWKFG
jgi:hypothetical protein